MAWQHPSTHTTPPPSDGERTTSAERWTSVSFEDACSFQQNQADSKTEEANEVETSWSLFWFKTNI